MNSFIEWISEADALPMIAQRVLYMSPRQSGEFWDTQVARLLCRHEAVVPMPVKPGGEWPTSYYWSLDHWGKDNSIVTGNGYWAYMDGIALPPGAEHKVLGPRNDRLIVQIGDQFIPQGRPAWLQTP